MRVVVAIDSLKGSMTSLEAGDAIREGILKADRNASVLVRPLADGGEGTVEALTLGMGGQLQKVQVTGPLGTPVEAVYGILNDGTTAVVEMSAASGITLVEEQDRNPLLTTTYGVGEMIADAIRKGCRHFIVGIGGSATNDGGIGMLQALGYGILDCDGNPVAYGAQGLEQIETSTDTTVIPLLKECDFKIACDVTNPLCGENGASAVYGPQKGATPSMILSMDRWLDRFADLTASTLGTGDKNAPGTGAAGGLGFAFLAYTNATLESGISIVLRETDLESYVKEADLVITGEGRLDGQTVYGKAPIGVAGIAKKFNKPVIAFSGAVTPDAVACNNHGIDAFFPILRRISTLQEAMDPETARTNMIETAEQVFRLIRTMREA